MGHRCVLVTLAPGSAHHADVAKFAIRGLMRCKDGFVDAYGDPICGRFVVGGRWSGLLSRETWAKEVLLQIEAFLASESARMPPEIEMVPIEILCAPWGDRAANSVVRVHTFARAAVRLRREHMTTRLHQHAQQLYEAAMPPEFRDKGLTVARTDEWNLFGAWDDVQPITEALYRAVLEPFRHHAFWRKPIDQSCHFDLDGEPVTRAMIGRKWVAVMDCYG